MKSGLPGRQLVPLKPNSHMGEFRFKKFSVVNERSAMKVNTDGVLLGALMTLDILDRLLLDAGTGTGTVALMAAQRLSEMRHGPDSGSSGAPDAFTIRAIDIDTPSSEEAALNFSRSPWSGVLSAENISLADLSAEFAAGACAASAPDSRTREFPCMFDHIFSNPPYFESELRSPDLRRREARHSESMSYREILEFASARLSMHGRCSLILPSETETDLCRHARMYGLFPFRIVRIRTVPGKPPRRIMAEFSRTRSREVCESLLTIQEQGRYTDQYTDLVSPFYLWA